MFQDKVSIDTQGRSGTYRIRWSSVVDNNKKTGEFRLINVTDNVVIGAVIVFSSGDTNDRIPIGGFSRVALTGTPKTYKVQYRTQPGVTGTQGIQDAKIELYRIS